jgi:hypothetical protein
MQTKISPYESNRRKDVNYDRVAGRGANSFTAGKPGF